MSLHRQRPATGRPVGTDGSDYSYRMTVVSKYTKVAEGKARLKSIIILQAFIQLLALLYVFIFPIQAVEIDALTAFAVCSGVIFYSLGELGRRGSKVALLKGYRWLSPCATLVAVVAVVKRSLHLREIKDGNREAVLTGITSVDFLFYLHILVGVVVELFQVHTTKNLLRNMKPSVD